MSNKTEDITVPKGDYGYNLNFTLKDADGNARNMTGYTAKFKVWAPGVSGTLLIDSGCTWADGTGATGICYYAVLNTNFTTEGRFLYEIEATKTGVVESAQNGWITVVESG